MKGNTVQFTNRWKPKFRLTDDEMDEIERDLKARRERVELAFQACRALIEAEQRYRGVTLEDDERLTEAYRLACEALGRKEDL